MTAVRSPDATRKWMSAPGALPPYPERMGRAAKESNMTHSSSHPAAPASCALRSPTAWVANARYPPNCDIASQVSTGANRISLCSVCISLHSISVNPPVDPDERSRHRLPGINWREPYFLVLSLHFLALDFCESTCRPGRTISGQNRDYAQWIAIIGIPCYKIGMGRIEARVGGRMGVRMRARAFETFRIAPETEVKILI